MQTVNEMVDSMIRTSLIYLNQGRYTRLSVLNQEEELLEILPFIMRSGV